MRIAPELNNPAGWPKPSILEGESQQIFGTSLPENSSADKFLAEAFGSTVPTGTAQSSGLSELSRGMPSKLRELFGVTQSISGMRDPTPEELAAYMKGER